MKFTMNKEKFLTILAILALTCCLTIYLSMSKILFNNKEENKIANLLFENITNIKQVGRLNIKEYTDNNIYYKITYPTTGEDTVDKIIISKIDELIENTSLEYSSDCDNINTYYFIDYEIYIGIDNILSLIIHENVETIDLNNQEKDYVYIIDVNKGEIINSKDIFNEGYKEVLNNYLEDTIIDESKLYIKENNIVIDNIEIPISEVKDYIKRDSNLVELQTSNIEEPVYTIINKEYIILKDTVIYSEATTSSEIIGDIKKDEIVKVYKESDKGWSIILYNNRPVFIESNKLTLKVESNQSEDSKNNPLIEEKYYAITNLNLRSEASIKSDILAEVKRNEEVIKIDETGSWSKVKYKDLEGYISTSYLSKTMVKNKVVKENVLPQREIDPTKPMVALTFDDGPNPVSTPKILNTLEKYNVKATFFDLGNLMLKYPDIVRREELLGEVGTHTYSHKNLNTLSNDEILKELELSKKAFNEVLGHDPIFLRPPYGNANSIVRALIDVPIINWNVDSLDWKYLNKDLTLNEIDKYNNLDGKIILMHSIYNQTAEAVEILVPDLLSQGYQIVSVSELAQYRGATLENGKIYYGFSK